MYLCRTPPPETRPGLQEAASIHSVDNVRSLPLKILQEYHEQYSQKRVRDKYCKCDYSMPKLAWRWQAERFVRCSLALTDRTSRIYCFYTLRDGLPVVWNQMMGQHRILAVMVQLVYKASYHCGWQVGLIEMVWHCLFDKSAHAWRRY